MDKTQKAAGALLFILFILWFILTCAVNALDHIFTQIP